MAVAVAVVISGSIPACAGEPRSGRVRRAGRRVYPRGCGGTLDRLACDGYLHGLSPRVRGNQKQADIAREMGGSIPACAGEPDKDADAIHHSKVYPRVCGGTAHLPYRTFGCWVYPRVCGGTRIPLSCQMDVWGLSPRVRGNPDAIKSAPAAKRSIPACAGEPKDQPRRLVVTAVYPRVCGGTPPAHWLTSYPTGLSPRVRGNLFRQPAQSAAVWSIPACAGEPLSNLRRQGRRRVYPRVCGGTRGLAVLKAGRAALSPRVRGNPA